MTLFLPFFPENSGLDVLNGAFYMSTYEFYILQQKKVVSKLPKNAHFDPKMAKKGAKTQNFENSMYTFLRTPKKYLVSKN